MGSCSSREYLINCAPAVATAGDKEKRNMEFRNTLSLSKGIEEWINEMKADIATGATAKGGFILPNNKSSRTEESHCHSWKKKTVFPNPNSYLPKPPRLLLLVCATANGTNTSTNELGLGVGGGAKGSGTTARGRRLLKFVKRRGNAEHDRLHNYPAGTKCWKTLQKRCELRAVLGDSMATLSS
ncbi:unnamed protein product [Prunus armeniaca]|uniref:Uncharacterized protein n=1 Tax=Prunus armeniaca TaxID=36596 RepID=A0A6J5W809_PRUAR|nr:unnamed protein product [Prunus armeniaca]